MKRTSLQIWPMGLVLRVTSNVACRNRDIDGPDHRPAYDRRTAAGSCFGVP